MFRNVVFTTALVGFLMIPAFTGSAEKERGILHVLVRATSSCVVKTEALKFDRNLRLRERHAREDDDDDEQETRSEERGPGTHRARGGNGEDTGTENFNWRIRVRCNRGTPYRLAADAGQHFFSGNRHMINNSAEFVAYRLFKKGRSGEEWGDRDFANNYPSGSSIGGRGNGRWKTHVIHGKLIRPPRIPSGILTDEVTISILN